MAWREDSLRAILSEADEGRIVHAIRVAERATSGEIRVHIEARSGGDPLSAARRWFHHLKIDRTAARNGVLFYLAVDDRAFAIVGDRGIHARVGDSCWAALRDDLHQAFARGAFVQGLEGAIAAVGALLETHFPRGAGDVNELSDSVSR